MRCDKVIHFEDGTSIRCEMEVGHLGDKHRNGLVIWREDKSDKEME